MSVWGQLYKNKIFSLFCECDLPWKLQFLQTKIGCQKHESYCLTDQWNRSRENFGFSVLVIFNWCQISWTRWYEISLWYFVETKRDISCDFNDQYKCGYTSTVLGDSFQWQRMNEPGPNTITSPAGDALGSVDGLYACWGADQLLSQLSRFLTQSILFTQSCVAKRHLSL